MVNKKNHGSGTGLEAFFSDDPMSTLNETTEGVQDLKISEIRPNPYQPRTVFDPEKLQELADSIKQSGVFQPILVKKGVNGYELVAGERRLRAAKLAGKTEIPAIIRDYSDDQVLEITVLENLQREKLSAIEEAKAFDTLSKKLNLTQDEVAIKVGKSRPYITNYLRLLQLPDKVQTLVVNGSLSSAQARALLKLKNSDDIVKLAQKVVREGLTVKQIDQEIDKLNDKKPVDKEKPVLTPLASTILSSLEDLLETKVKIKQSKNGNGKIEISFNSADDLARINELLDSDNK